MVGIKAAQDLVPVAAQAAERFERGQADEFSHRSTSEETCRAYKRVVREFFTTVGNLLPKAVEPRQVREWRDRLLRRHLLTRPFWRLI